MVLIFAIGKSGTGGGCFCSWPCVAVWIVRLCLRSIWITSVIAVKGTLADMLFRLLYRNRPGIKTRFVHFTRGQQNFRGFNFREWLLTHEKRKNKYLAKITNHMLSDVRIVSFLVLHHSYCCYSYCKRQ